MYAGLVACCPLTSHGEYADGTDRQMDRQTDARHITLSARGIQRNKPSMSLYVIVTHANGSRGV